MSLRYSLAAAAALIGVSLFAAPASAVMQVIQIPDPNAPVQSDQKSPPDGLFDKSFSDHWSSSTGGQSSQGMGNFHFTVNGAAGGYSSTSSSSPSAYDDSKQPGSEFYQPMRGSSYPNYYYGH